MVVLAHPEGFNRGAAEYIEGALPVSEILALHGYTPSAASAAADVSAAVGGV